MANPFQRRAAPSGLFARLAGGVGKATLVREIEDVLARRRFLSRHLVREGSFLVDRGVSLELKGVSEHGFEDAIRQALDEASRAYPGVTRAEVLELGTELEAGRIARWRVKLKATRDSDPAQPGITIPRTSACVSPSPMVSCICSSSPASSQTPRHVGQRSRSSLGTSSLPISAPSTGHRRRVSRAAARLASATVPCSMPASDGAAS
jgi:flavin-binding protein dodecin